ncbi:MAG: STAS domain-containing protein [Xanthomonadales bacterium]
MSEDYTLEWLAAGGARLGGRLTFRTCTPLFEELQRRGETTPVDGPVDLAEVDQVDSAGLAVLLEWQAQQKAAGHRLSLVNAPDSLLRLAQLAEAVELLNLSGRDETAV